MELKLEATSCFSPDVFIINKIEAEFEDFGKAVDTDRGSAPIYGCGDHQFVSSIPTSDLLKKYSISSLEYEEIISALKDKFNWGFCRQCE